MHERKNVHARITVRDRQIWRVQGLPECALHERLIEAHGIIACIDGRPPAFELCSYGRHHVVKAWKVLVVQHFWRHARNLQGHGRRNNPGQTLTPDFKAVDFFQLNIGQNGCKLQDLIEHRIGTGRFGIIEYEQRCFLPDDLMIRTFARISRFGNL